MKKSIILAVLTVIITGTVYGNSENSNADYKMGLGYQYLGLMYDGNKGNYEKALECFNKSIEMNPDNARVYYSMGLVYDDTGSFDRAIECYQKSLEIDPNDVKVYIGLGNAFEEKNDFDTAIECYYHALEIDPNYTEAYFNLGKAYFNQGKHNKAIECYRKVLDKNPSDTRTCNNLGLAYFNIGSYEEAIECYKKVLEFPPVTSNLNFQNDNPETYSTYLNIANTYTKIANYDKAIEFYKKVIKENSDCAEAYRNMGIAYFGKGQTNSSANSFYQAGLIFLNQENRSGVLKIVEDMKQFFPESPFIIKLTDKL